MKTKTLFVITAAGDGTRFQRAGYADVKPAIVWRGKSLLWWSLVGVQDLLRETTVCVVSRREHSIQPLIDKTFRDLALSVPRHEVLTERTKGQADTVALTLAEADPDAPLIIWNVDTFIRPGSTLPSSGNWLHLFPSASPSMSYARVSGRLVEEVREKVVISPWASSGLYGFASCRRFMDALGATYPAGHVGESYVAPLYNWVLSQEDEVRPVFAGKADVVPLGTPEDLASAPEALTAKEVGWGGPARSG